MFKKLYFKFALINYYIKKNWYYLAIVLLIGSSYYIFRPNLQKIMNLPIFQTEYIGLAGHYTNNNLPEEINNLITYGLTSYTENNKIIASPIVESINMEDGNHRYIIKLKKNLYWHNGQKFTADDIKYEIPGAVIKAENNYTLMITTPNLYSPLLSTLTRPLYGNRLSGLGPNKVIKIEYQDGYLKTLVVQNLKNKKKTVYRFYTNDSELITAFKLGEITTMETTIISPEIEKQNRLKIDKTLATNKKYLAIFFNTEKINDKTIRQALAYATPKTKDKHERALSPISPISWAYNPTIKEYIFNPSRAKELFDKTEMGTIKIAVTDRQLLDTAENIKKSWKDILGINVETEVVNKIDSQTFDAFLAYGGMPIDPDQYLFWHSTQTNTNLTKFNNPRIDTLLEEGRQTFDLIERKNIYLDFQKYLLEECPVIFLSYPTVYTISRLK
jgi:peptide/nickel transport system substrate-binding protein